MIVEMLLLVNCRQVNIQHQRLTHSCMLVFVFVSVYVFVFVCLFVPVFVFVCKEMLLVNCRELRIPMYPFARLTAAVPV